MYSETEIRASQRNANWLYFFVLILAAIIAIGADGIETQLKRIADAQEILASPPKEK